jgi:hypothetical protein
VREKLLFSDVALVVGAVSAGVSIFLFARPPKVTPPARPQVVLAADRTGGMLTVRGAF